MIKIKPKRDHWSHRFKPSQGLAVVSLRKKLYVHCSELVSYRNGFVTFEDTANY